MKTTKTLAILVLALGLMVCPAELAGAATIGTAFTYQGRLVDDNSVANGQYDFQFRVFDNSNVIDGRQQGRTIYIYGHKVIDGNFTVELDFGSGIFYGDARWLEIGVRPAGSTDSFTILSPLQEIKPTPNAIHASHALQADEADTLNGFDSTAFASVAHSHDGVYALISHNHDGSDITTGIVADGLIAASIARDSELTWDNLGGIPEGFADKVDNIGGTDSDWTISGTDIYSGVSGNVGIGTTTPSAKLDVEVSSGGAATIGSSSNSATGAYAIAMGYNTEANGDYSTAMGTSTITSGFSSTAMGHDTTASGRSSTAMGYGTTASAYYSTAMGRDTTASAWYSTAMGHGTTANGSASTAMGSSTTASGDYSTAMGDATIASGYSSTAMGYGTTASAWFSTAMGFDTTASGDSSTAMGRGIEASAHDTVGIGLDDTYRNITQPNTMAIMGGNVGIGTTSPTAKLHIGGTPGVDGIMFPDNTLQSTAAAGSTSVPIGAVIDWWRPNDSFAVPDGYQICNGSVVTDAQSPFNGQTLPNLRDRFVRGAATVNDIGTLGGSESTASRVVTMGTSTKNMILAGPGTFEAALSTHKHTTNSHSHYHIPLYVGLLKIMRIR